MFGKQGGCVAGVAPVIAVTQRLRCAEVRSGSYLFVYIIHPEAQGLPDRWVVVSAPRLQFEQAGLLQVV